MTGVIWVIQLNHYPSIKAWNHSEFLIWHRFHTQRITYIVAPMMLIELGSLIFIFFISDKSLFWLLNLILLIFIWISTALIQIPQHKILEKNYDPKVIEKLVLGNWIRVFLWSLRSASLIYYLITMVK
jgi:hypothetical protein